MRIPSVLLNVVIAFVAVAFLLALPILFPLAVAERYLYQRRLRSAAEKHVCSSCGAVLGIRALYEADEHWRAWVTELHRNHPGMLLRLVRSVHAICVSCGERYAFNEALRSFEPTREAV